MALERRATTDLNYRESSPRILSQFRTAVTSWDPVRDGATAWALTPPPMVSIARGWHICRRDQQVKR